jgi:hypothetical protein
LYRSDVQVKWREEKRIAYRTVAEKPLGRGKEMGN